MDESIKRQEEVMYDNSLDEETKTKLFKMYACSFGYHAMKAIAYQAKYYHKKKG